MPGKKKLTAAEKRVIARNKGKGVSPASFRRLKTLVRKPKKRKKK